MYWSANWRLAGMWTTSSCGRRRKWLGHPLLYVADIPYLLNKPQKLRSKTAGMKELVKAVSEAGLRSWLEAVRAYETQIEPEFKQLELMQKKMSAYWAERRGIRFWKVK